MRTLNLTHDEIALIQRALGIAEMKMAELRQEYLKAVVNVRGVDNLTDVRSETENMLKLENQFCDLLLSIKHGEKDI